MITDDLHYRLERIREMTEAVRTLLFGLENMGREGWEYKLRGRLEIAQEVIDSIQSTATSGLYLLEKQKEAGAKEE